MYSVPALGSDSGACGLERNALRVPGGKGESCGYYGPRVPEAIKRFCCSPGVGWAESPSRRERAQDAAEARAWFPKSPQRKAFGFTSFFRMLSTGEALGLRLPLQLFSHIGEWKGRAMPP